jgi:hypothetical protein
MKHRNLAIGRLALGVLMISCSDPPSAGDTPGSGSDIEEKSTESPEDAGTGAACLASISGVILKNGESGMVAGMIPCIGTTCFSAGKTDPDGRFRWEHPLSEGEPCQPYDFDEKALHIEVAAAENPREYAAYAFILRPTRADISDKGPNDFDLDIGVLSLYVLPDEAAVFEPSAGASVDLTGLAFDLPPDGIVKRVKDTDEPIDHPQDIRVFKAPLDTWQPPFVTTPLSALYFIAPRWAKLAGPGAVLSVDPPEGWDEGDGGRLYLLGGYTSSFGDIAVRDRSAYIYRDADGACINTDESEGLERIADGDFAACGTVSMVQGKLLTAPVPRFTWVGISKEY